MLKEIIKSRNWDTEFFGIKVGELKECPKVSQLIEIKAELEAKGFEFLLYRHTVGLATLLDVAVLGNLGFSYIDTHLKFNIPLAHLDVLDSRSVDNKISGITIRSVAKSEVEYIPELQRIGVELSSVSRFALDPQISSKSVERLYQNWIKNGFVGNMADYIYIAFDASDSVLGFVYFQKDKEDPKLVDLSLLAVDSSIRGSGLGTKLINFAFLDLQEQYDSCSVVVSMSNPRAIRFYEKQGFLFSSASQVYHMHRKV